MRAAVHQKRRITDQWKLFSFPIQINIIMRQLNGPAHWLIEYTPIDRASM
jgi:expansin (peptidoglycan-binding protein)